MNVSSEKRRLEKQLFIAAYLPPLFFNVISFITKHSWIQEARSQCRWYDRVRPTYTKRKTNSVWNFYSVGVTDWVRTVEQSLGYISQVSLDIFSTKLFYYTETNGPRIQMFMLIPGYVSMPGGSIWHFEMIVILQAVVQYFGSNTLMPVIRGRFS